MESETDLLQLSAAENLTLPTTSRIFATKVNSSRFYGFYRKQSTNVR